MFRLDRLMLFFAISIGAITSDDSIAGYRRRPLVHQQSQVQVHLAKTIIASRQARGVAVTIANADGKLLGGDNDFCVLFETTEKREPVDVQNVSIDFALLVGKIEEQPIRVRLPQVQPGRYCGHVNLGKQYYVPASYYAFVLYTDTGGKKRKERLFLSVR